MEGDRLLDVIGVLILLGLVAGGAMLLVVAINSQPNESQPAPDTNWTVERLNGTHIRLTLDSGEPVETDKLIVTVTGAQRAVDWSGTLFEGDGGILRARPGRSVTIYWKASVHSDRVILASWDGA